MKSLEKRWGSGLEVIYAPVKKLSLEQSLEKVIMQQGEPFGDPSIMAHGFLVEAARNHNVSVLLGGQGGDEISMGYEWMYQRVFSYALNSGDFSSFFSFIRQDSTPIFQIVRLIVAGVAPTFEHYLRLKARKKQKKSLAPTLFLDSPEESFGKVNSLRGIYLESLKTVGLPHLCHYDDRSTMALSVEGRMPFLDHRLLEFVSRLQPEAFYENGFSKNIFRKAFREILPEDILLRRDKIGFHTPVIDLLLKNTEWVKKIINDPSMDRWINPSCVQELSRKLDVHDLDVPTATFLFRIISVHLWYLTFFEKKN